jgi:hypothetical protein
MTPKAKIAMATPKPKPNFSPLVTACGSMGRFPGNDVVTSANTVYAVVGETGGAAVFGMGAIEIV